MKVIVPLAGPDFVGADGAVKADTLIEKVPLLRRALESRSWWLSGDVQPTDFVFILRDDEPSRRFAQTRLSSWYPGSSIALISTFTRGAAMSALAGLSMLPDAQEPICFDLADILFEENADPALFFSDAVTGGVALTFSSTSPIYSYLRRDEAGDIVEAAEKRVISSEASAGVYLFRSLSVYLKALAYTLDYDAAFTHNGLYFVCPVFNGVIAQGLRVKGVSVERVRDIKTNDAQYLGLN